MDITTLREQVKAGNYLVRSHAITHSLKEGFTRQDMLDAILNGTIIEAYPDDQRVLVCGRTYLGQTRPIYLHLVCEYTDPNYIEFITAYIPDELQWEYPPIRRRKRSRL